MSTFAEQPTGNDPIDASRRTIDYNFKADCTLYLENETLVRKVIEGRWYSPRPLNASEWQAAAEHALAWIVGTLHHYDPQVPVRVDKHVVHKWMGFYDTKR